MRPASISPSRLGACQQRFASASCRSTSAPDADAQPQPPSTLKTVFVAHCVLPVSVIRAEIARSLFLASGKSRSQQPLIPIEVAAEKENGSRKRTMRPRENSISLFVHCNILQQQRAAQLLGQGASAACCCTFYERPLRYHDRAGRSRLRNATPLSLLRRPSPHHREVRARL